MIALHNFSRTFLLKDREGVEGVIGWGLFRVEGW
jgi:hypothetical protein